MTYSWFPSDNSWWLNWNITKFHISRQRWYSFKCSGWHLTESVFSIPAISLLSIVNKYTDGKPTRYSGDGEFNSAVTSNGVLSTCRTDCNHVNNNNNPSYHKHKWLSCTCHSTNGYAGRPKFFFCWRYGMGELITLSVEQFQSTFDT